MKNDWRVLKYKLVAFGEKKGRIKIAIDTTFEIKYDLPSFADWNAFCSSDGSAEDLANEALHT